MLRGVENAYVRLVPAQTRGCKLGFSLVMTQNSSNNKCPSNNIATGNSMVMSSVGYQDVVCW
jgi:hypothetical protein